MGKSCFHPSYNQDIKTPEGKKYSQSNSGKKDTAKSKNEAKDMVKVNASRVNLVKAHRRVMDDV